MTHPALRLDDTVHQRVRARDPRGPQRGAPGGLRAPARSARADRRQPLPPHHGARGGGPGRGREGVRGQASQNLGVGRQGRPQGARRGDRGAELTDPRGSTARLMPAIRLGGDSQPWPGDGRAPTARLRSREVEVGGVAARAVSSAGDGVPSCFCTAGSTTPTPGSAFSTGSRSPDGPGSPTTCPASAPPPRWGRVWFSISWSISRRRRSSRPRGGRAGPGRRRLARRLGRAAACRVRGAPARRSGADRPRGRTDGAPVLHPRPRPGGLADHRGPGAGAAGCRPRGGRAPVSLARLRRPGGSTRRSSTASPAFTSSAP